MHEGTGGLQDLQASFLQAFSRPGGSSVSRDHHAGGRNFGGLVLDFNPFGTKILKHAFVVHQVAEDGEWTGFGLLEGQRDRVPDSETHAEMTGADNLHENNQFEFMPGGASGAISIHFVLQSV